MQSKKQNIAVFVAWPYANAPTLHIGHLVGAILPADIFARFNRKLGNKVLHVTGTDMHGTPVSVKAAKQNMPSDVFAISNHNNFVAQLEQLHINFNLYTNTHNSLHFEVVNNMGRFLYEKGFLFPKKTKMLYDTKAKKYLPDRYVEGTCPYCGYNPARGDQCDNCGRILDPLELKDPVSKLTGTKPVIKEVTNLYLDLPKFADKLLELANKNPHLRPHVKEMTVSFIKEGLKPRPVTRNMDWGIPVDIEGFKDQVWYVWFEAVIGYLSAAIQVFNSREEIINSYTSLTKEYNVNFIYNPPKGTWEEFWKNDAKHYYFLGKDNIPFHTIIWPAQLLMYNFKYQDEDLFSKFKLPAETLNTPLNLYYDVPANNFLNMNSAKISKSTGNYIGLDELLEKYGATVVRFVFARLMPETKDSNFTMDKFKALANNELVATIGNLIYRVLSFAKNKYKKVPEGSVSEPVKQTIEKYYAKVCGSLEKVRLSKALEYILEFAAYGNKYFNDNAPWKAPETVQSKQTILDSANIVINLINMLSPFLPGLTQNVASMLDIPIMQGLASNPDKVPFQPIFYDGFAIKNLKVPVKKVEG